MSYKNIEDKRRYNREYSKKNYLKNKDEILRKARERYKSNKSESPKKPRKTREYTFENLAGKKYGKLTVINRVYPNKKDNKVYWLCKCDCGNTKIISGEHLKNGTTRSCGCLKKFPNGIANMRNAITNYKHSAKRRNIKWELTEEQFAKITQQNCYYCGAKPSNIARKKENNGDYIYNGIDRLDNTKGYTIDNVVPCCFMCNQAKHNHTLQEFKEWVKRAYDKMYGVGIN